MLGLVSASAGASDVTIALIDGPIFAAHPSLADARIVIAPASRADEPDPFALAHATFLASMLVGAPGAALGLCPGCTLLSFPLVDGSVLHGDVPADEVAGRFAVAIREGVARGAAVIQLSLDFSALPDEAVTPIREALAAAAVAGVRTVAAAGNTAGPSASSVLAAPGVVPVGIGRFDGSAHRLTSWGVAIGAQGLLAPGEAIVGAVPPDRYELRSGSSYAASFVTAAFALLRTLPTRLDPDLIWGQLLAAHRPTAARSLVPPPLDGDLSRELLAA
jgi:subtilisin family serine protease